MKTKLLFFLMLALPGTMWSHPIHSDIHNGTPAEISQTKEERAKWFEEAREMKHRFLIKELDLTKEQQKHFFELYDRMESENHKIQRETRAMEKRVYELGDKASDLDYEKATDALYEARQKESEIEMRYREEFKKVLSPAQMFRLKGAERKFTRELMERHQKIRRK